MESDHDQNTYWVSKVLDKIGALQKMGADFKSTQWIFDWDKTLAEKENIANYGSESRALLFVSTTGAITITSAKPDKYHLRLPQLNEHGGDLPLSVDKASQAGRGSVWYRAYWITNFDYDKYLRQCELYGSSITSTRAGQKTVTTAPTLDINKLKVEPTSYDATNMALNLSGRIVQVGKQRDRKSETQEAKLMRMLFSVKHFLVGVGVSNIYPVKDHQNAREQRKKARALVTAINKKLPEELKGQELIKFDKVKFYINPTYLKR